MVIRRWATALALLTWAITCLAGAALSGDLTFSHTLSYREGIGYQALYNPTVEISLASPSQGSIRAEVRMRIPPSGAGTHWDAYISRSYLRARLSHLRLTAGKGPLVWGDGFLFNAADVAIRRFDRTRSDPALDAIWQSALYIPIADFDFVEVVALPTIDSADLGVGGRFYLGRWALKAEAGYVYRQRTHTPYVSLQGHFGLDWWLASSADITDDIDEVRISFGILHFFSLFGGRTLSMRAEARSTVVGVQQDWAIGVEATYAPAQSHHYSLTATYTSDQMSLAIAAGTTITALEALTISAFLNVSTDAWHLDQVGATLSASHRF